MATMESVRLALLLLLALASTLLLAVLLASLSRSASSKIPGPLQLPLIGRIHDLDRKALWKNLHGWALDHGPIYRTSMVGESFVIVSSHAIAHELLVQRGSIYSGRPQIRALFDHKGGIEYVALMDRHNAAWARQRKWVHAAMVDASRAGFHGVIEREVRRWLVMLLLAPGDFHALTREHCGRVMSRLCFDDAALGRENGVRADETLGRMSVSGPLVNVLPFLWHLLPEAVNPWKRYERRRMAGQRTWWLRNYRVAKTRFLRGELAESTFAHRYFQGLQRDGDGDEQLAQSGEEEAFASCMLGFQNLVGVVTIAGPLQYLLMAMALHPAWQARAQDEVDRVCGERMPGLGDVAALPTVRACLKETLRWRPTVPLGVPHQAECDDVYMGETIEKGAVVMACEWSMSRVPDIYPDGDAYRPERYLEPGWPTFQEPLSRYPNLREGKAGMHSFGYGRRTCLGQDLADDELFLSAAGVLWGFRMRKTRCPLSGDEVEWDSEATNSHVILEPTAWPMEFVPRSRERAKAILGEYAGAREND